MADGRDIGIWDNHAQECREERRKPFKIQGYKNNWLRAKLLELDEVYNCVDIGCGPGYWINLFEGKNYTGVDQSTGMLTLAQELSPDAEFVSGNARCLPEVFGDRKFDLVFTSAVLQHNRHVPDKEEIVKGIHHILRDGGYYLCTENTFRADNCPQSVGNPDYQDAYSFTPEGWKKWMGERGFELIEYHAPSEYIYRKV